MAQEKERQRIARELHDDIGQQLALAEMQLCQLREDDAASLLNHAWTHCSNGFESSRTAREISHAFTLPP